MERLSRSSTIVAALRSAGTVFGSSVERSTLGRATRAIEAATRSSFTYRWLTAEPQTEVVVVDLRETIVFGSLLAALEGPLETFLSKRTGSRLFEAGGRSIEYVEDAPVRALSIVVLAGLVTNLSVTIAAGSSTATGTSVTLGLVLLALLGLRVDSSLEDLRATRGARFLVALLEPPDPGDRGPQSTRESVDVDRSTPSPDEDGAGRS